MMADTTQAPINGTYATPHPYPDSYVSHAAVNPVGNSYHPAPTGTPSNGPSLQEGKNEIPKDEVGWYFVEQYYTTMSRNPEKLPLFYSRHSHFVFGTEAESVPVAVGQKAINEKIKALDFHDCKVRVLNVDSQASFENILVAVIGEISNRSEPSRKFTQTFVLAEQPNGYYVLNDIFRYLADDEEEFVSGETAQAEPEEAAELQDTSVSHPGVAPEPEPAVAAPANVEESVAETVTSTTDSEVEKSEAASVNGIATPEKPAVPVTPAVPVVPTEPEVPKAEKPQPTPAASAPKEAAAAAKKEPAVPAKSVPKTWASIASANKRASAAAAIAAASTAQAKTAAPSPSVAPALPAQNAQPQPEQPAVAESSTASQESSIDGAGWQTAGHEHNKKQARSGDEHKHPAYIKNVNEKVDAALLKTVLSRFGKLTHFDVNRARNCAFVDFADQASYNAAVAANPHQIGTEQITVEERRIRAGNASSNGFPASRGGANRGRSDGRAGSQGRGGNFQRDQARGGFASRGGRGGNVNKGRSQPQAA
ncbi:hypothetical protein BGW36DRAFT_135153 [Talaromyces proteolyticus]|uniref:NTF2 domain-containing protein n=1 Tax=Talaromyces proteolyticus TaxID=1131652 RepID=A0AAD4Q2V9_9EURO|nr:uncharacterized protein BGW36DRAFT_135153 [Talaromyces proteolyticus]KAH8700748.1 hypothetical protein BGW36DRAFT_135153 [Talaromyces proteolyticus]